MPKSFFSVRHAGRTSHHIDGIDFPDIEAVQLEAIQSTGELLRELNLPFATGAEWRMEVADEARKPLFSLRVVAESHEQGLLPASPPSIRWPRFAGRQNLPAAKIRRSQRFAVSAAVFGMDFSAVRSQIHRMGHFDQTKRCPRCGCVMVLALPPQGNGPRTLQCLECDRPDPLRSDVVKWLEGGLQPPR
jgi:hypothetical protein